MVKPIFVSLLVVASLAVGFGVGTSCGDRGSSEPSSQSASTSDSHVRKELAVARSVIADRDRTIARLREGTAAVIEERGPSAPPTSVPATAPTGGVDDISELPGSPVATAVRSADAGDVNWMSGFQTILPNRGEPSNRGLTVSVNTDALTGAVSTMLTAPDVTVASEGLVAIRFAESAAWTVVHRDRASDGVTERGGSSSALRRARDLADVWQIAAKRSRSLLEVPRVAGCSTIRFQANGTSYTLVTCAEYGPDGKPVAVTIRDGR